MAFYYEHNFFFGMREEVLVKRPNKLVWAWHVSAHIEFFYMQHKNTNVVLGELSQPSKLG